MQRLTREPNQRLLQAALFLSGAASLLAEALWLRLLIPVLGSGTMAVCVVLSGFMAGMAAGAWVIGRRADAWRTPVRLYALLEGAVGLWCVAAPHAVRAWDSPWAALLLLPPALAAGGTLPLLMRAGAGSTGETVSRFYFWNTLGGGAGAAAAAWSVRDFGVSGSMSGAALLSLGAAALVWFAASGLEEPEPPAEEQASVLSPSVWLLFALCGAATLTHEALWTRLLALVFGSTAQAFAVVLAAFLVGLAWGGPLARLVLRWEPEPSAALGWLQTAAGLTAILSLAAFPFLPPLMARVYGGGFGAPAVALAQALAALLFLGGPAACLGAALPVVSHAVRGRPGAAVGALYAVSTAAAAAGPWVAGFLLVPRLGLVGAAAASTAFNLALGAWGLALGEGGVRRRLGFGAAAFAAAAWLVLPRPEAAILHSGVSIYAAHMLKAGLPAARVRTDGGYGLLFEEDGREASVTVWGTAAGRHALVINGKADASDGADMATQTLLGHLPVLVAEPRPGSRALVIGLGSGVTASAVARHAFAEVVVAELEPAVARAAVFFTHVNGDVLHRRGVRLELTDARKLLRAETGRFGLIVSEPSNPWISGMSHLFSSEFLALARSRLEPGGVFCQWLPTYNMTPRALAIALETVRGAFPHVSVWTLKTDLILVAGDRPQRPDFARVLAALGRPELAAELARVGVLAPSDLLALRAFGPEGLSALTGEAGVKPHTDDRPELEFEAPRALADADAGRLNDEAVERRAEAVSPAVAGAAGLERWLARSLIVARRPDAAALELAFVRESDPWRRGLERDLAELYLRAGRPREAAGLLEACARRSPRDPDAWLDLARARLEAGLTDSGVEALEAFAALDRSGRRVEAALAAVRAGPDSGKAFLAVALALAQRGRGEAAAAAFEAVLRRDPTLLDAARAEAHALR